MKKEKKELINFNRICKDIYNIKKVSIATALSCLFIYIVFRVQINWLRIISIFGFIISFYVIIKQTQKLNFVQNNEFFIVSEKVCNGSITIRFRNKEFVIDEEFLPNGCQNSEDEMFVLFVNNIPSYIYSGRRFKLDTELTKKILRKTKI